MTTLIGRSGDLAAIAKLLDEGRERGSGLCVIAEAGMGKSALLDAADALARETDWRVLRCRGAEAETAMAYSALTDLFTPLVADVETWLPDPQRRALRVVMLRTDPGADEAVEPHAVGRAVTASLQTASSAGPVLLIIDDSHWLDAESGRAIGFAMRRLDDRPVVLLTARRDIDSRRSTEPDSELAGPYPTLRLSPLSADEIEQLLAARGITPPRATLRRVQRISGGHPLYALELARHLAVVPDGTLPTSLAGLLEERLRQLPADALPTLAAAAQLSAPTRAQVRAGLDVDAATVDEALDAAADAGVVREIDGVLVFAHPLLAEAASATATAGWRREVHRRMATAIVDVEQRAVHASLAHSDPDESVAAIIEAGATRARARAAPELAAELILAALRLTPDEAIDARRRRRVDGAYHCVAAGQPERATELMLAALEDETDEEARADIEWRAGMMHFLAGDVLRCIELIERARSRTTDDAARSHLNTRLANMYCWVGDYLTGAEIANSIELDRLDGAFRVNAAGTIFSANFCVGRASGLDPQQIINDFEQLCPLPPPHEHPISRLMPALTLSGSTTEAAQIATRALDRAVADADDVGVAWLAASLTHAELRAGRWDAAARAADDSLRAGRRADSAPALVFALSAAAAVAAYRGDGDTATTLAGELIGLGVRQPLLSCTASGHIVLGFLALARGEAAGAHEHYMVAAELLDRETTGQPVMPPLRWYLVDALIDAEDIVEAQRRIEQLAAVPDNPLASAFAASGRARIAALQGDRAAADAAFEQALSFHDQLQWPFERAVTVYRQGCAHRDQQRRSQARSALSEAIDVFTALGAAVWEARARQALAAISGRVPSSPDALTRTEQEVASRAATGLTNQQIAEQLFISPKTVATHLSHAYAKLNVRSRTELANRLLRTT